MIQCRKVTAYIPVELKQFAPIFTSIRKYFQIISKDIVFISNDKVFLESFMKTFNSMPILPRHNYAI